MHHTAVCLGWTVDGRETNTMLLHPFDNVRRWLPHSPGADQLELCVRQSRLRQEQDDLLDDDHHGCSVHRSRHLCPSQRQKRRGEGQIAYPIVQSSDCDV